MTGASFDGGILRVVPDETGERRPVWQAARASDGASETFDAGLHVYAAGDAQFLDPDPSKVLQLRPTLKSEVPPYRDLVPGEQMLCIIIDGEVVRRIFIRRPLKGGAAIRHGLAILAGIEPHVVAYLHHHRILAARLRRARSRPKSRR